MSKGSQTTTQQTSTSPPGYVNDAYQQLVANTGQLAQTPYTPFTGEGVAPVNPQQYQGIGNINQYALSAQPAYAQALGLVSGASQQLTPEQIQQYYNPYQQNVIDTTQQQFNQMNQMALNNIQGNAAAQGALGGDRSGVAKAAYYQGVLPGQEQAIAGLENQGYSQALATAGQQFQQNPEAAAYGLGSLGSGAENAALQGAGAQVGAGSLEQQTSQALDQYLYNQYLAQMGYPFAINQYAAGIDTGIGSVAGGTSQGTTTGPPPSLLGQILGLGVAGAGAYGAYQGAQPKQAAGGRIRGYQTGGSPVMPYAGGPSYIPSAGGLAHGSGPPQVRPPAAPGQQGGASSMFGEAQQLAGMGKAGQGLGSWLGSGSGTPSPAQWTKAGLDLPGGTLGPGLDVAASAGPDAAALGADVVGATAANGGGDAAMALLPLLLAKKGGRIQLPMRSGMGMPSFVRGYQDGGGPTSEDVAKQYMANQEAIQAYGLGSQNVAPTSQFEDLGPNSMLAENTGWTPDQQALPPEITSGSSRPGVGGAYQPALAYDDGQPGGVGGGYQPPAHLPPSARPQVSAGAQPGFLGMSPDFWQSVMAAGLGTAAAAGRPGASPLGAIGEGGMYGLKTYGGIKGKEADIEMESRKLDQAAQAESDRIAMEGRRLTEMTPYQKQEVDLRRQQLEQENWAAFTDQSGNTRFFNKKTGEIRNTPPIHAPGTPTSSVSGTTSTAQIQPPEAPPPTKEEQKKPTQFAGLETNNVTADDWGKDVKPAGTVTGPVNRNEAVLQDLDPNMQALVKGVADYRKDIRTLGFRDRTMVGRFVTAYDPDWSEANYNTINQTMKNFKGTGVEARNMQSQDMAVQHVGNALDNIRTLDLGNVPLLNAIKTGAMAQYDPKTQAAVGKLKTDVHAIGDELMRSFRGTGSPSEKEATQWMDNLDYNNPAKMRASLQEAASLLGGRITAAGSRYNDAMGERYARDPLEWMSGKGRAAYQRALSIDPIKGEGPAPQAGQAGQAAGPAVVRSGTVNSGPNAGKRVIEYSDGHREYQ